MKINSLTSPMAFLSLVIMLPIRHLISYFQGSQLLPIFRGLGLIPLFFAIVLFVCFLRSKRQYISWYGWFVFVCVMLSAGMVIFSSPDFKDFLGRSSFYFNINRLAYYFMYFYIGYYYDGFEQYRNWIFSFWFIMLINLLWHFNFQVMSISFQGFDPDTVSMYLFLGDSFAIWSLLVLSFLTKSPFMSTFVSLLSAIALFAFISRTALYSFLIVIPLVIFFTKKSFKYWVFPISLLLVFSSGLSRLLEPNMRMLAFLDLGSDASMIERSFLFREGLSSIQKNWFLGDYGGQLKYGGLGSYIHNYLSLWRQFGILTFMAFLILLVSFIIKCWKSFWASMPSRETTPQSFFLIVAGGFCFIEIVTARSYASPYIWLFLGMILNTKLFGRKTGKERVQLHSLNKEPRGI